MIIQHNVPIYSICWLNHAKGGMIGTYYEPENKKELTDLCRTLYKSGKSFDVIGHTSNIYFLQDYNVETVVSTRRVRDVVYNANNIIADCGSNVKVLAHAMVNEGVKGFEGLIDLPGTVAAAVYGNASCFGCSINDMLVSIELLEPNGDVVIINKEELKFSRRSSAMKRGEKKGVILSVTLRKELGDEANIRRLAERNHERRVLTQPTPKDNLGSIYASTGGYSMRSIGFIMLANIYCALLKLTGKSAKKIKNAKKNAILSMMGAKDLIPYVYGWNRYIWKDESSHTLFWKFHKIHQKLFNNSDFEIEIRGKIETI